MYIYTITNLINGKQYVGQTMSPDVMIRWRKHKHDSKSGSKTAICRISIGNVCRGKGETAGDYYWRYK